jgi:type IV pilus assembly protein PilV
MKDNPEFAKEQSGVMLLEALIAILIFSLGILTVIGMQTMAVKMTGDAKYRVDATMLANQLVGQMWVSGYNAADLKTKFQTDGDDYTIWFNNIADSKALPGVARDDETLKPQVVVDDTAGVAKGRVTITLFWRTPEMSASQKHRFILVSQVARNEI